MNISGVDGRKRYRPPEMAGAEIVPSPESRAAGAPVIRQPGTMGAILVAAGLIAGLGLLYLGS